MRVRVTGTNDDLRSFHSTCFRKRSDIELYPQIEIKFLYNKIFSKIDFSPSISIMLPKNYIFDNNFYFGYFFSESSICSYGEMAFLGRISAVHLNWNRKISS